MNKKIGFIGTGMMGTAIIKSIAASGTVEPRYIYAYDIDGVRLSQLGDETGINTTSDMQQLAAVSEVIVIAVKPNIVGKVLDMIKNVFTADKLLISIAVGLPISLYLNALGTDKKVVRTMPNTPMLVGEGMTLVSCSERVTAQESENVLELFRCAGKAELMEEKLMSEVTALTSSSPAYVFMFIEAMADAAVLSGIPRAMAYRLGAQAVLGSAKLVLESGKHPGELKDQVCSPAGTTIEAVKALEKSGFRHAIIDAMEQCTMKAKEIGKSIK